MKNIFITGTAGFIGFHLTKLLLREGFKVHGYDSINDYYDVNLKLARQNILLKDVQFLLLVQQELFMDFVYQNIEFVH